MSEHETPEAFSPAKAEQELTRIVAAIVAEIAETDHEFRSLYNNPSLPDHPVPFFGGVPSASYLTLSPNPSSDDFGAPTMGCDLTRHCLDYFNHAGVKPHQFFPDWEAALAGLSPCRFSYSSNLAHVDLSPRATRSLTALNTSDATKLFLRMVGLDIKHLFRILAVVWPNLRGLFASGTVTDDRYIDEILRKYGPFSGFEFGRPHLLPPATRPGAKPAKSRRSHPKLYQVSYKGEIKPLFFCPVGPSAKRPGQKEQFLAQFRDNAAFLRPILCPDVIAQGDTTVSFPT